MFALLLCSCTTVNYRLIDTTASTGVQIVEAPATEEAVFYRDEIGDKSGIIRTYVSLKPTLPMYLKEKVEAEFDFSVTALQVLNTGFDRWLERERTTFWDYIFSPPRFWGLRIIIDLETDQASVDGRYEMQSQSFVENPGYLRFYARASPYDAAIQNVQVGRPGYDPTLSFKEERTLRAGLLAYRRAYFVQQYLDDVCDQLIEQIKRRLQG